MGCLFSEIPICFHFRVFSLVLMIDGFGCFVYSLHYCSFSAFYFGQHGNSNYGSPHNAPRSRRSSQGKMEKSFLRYVPWQSLSCVNAFGFFASFSCLQAMKAAVIIEDPCLSNAFVSMMPFFCFLKNDLLFLGYKSTRSSLHRCFNETHIFVLWKPLLLKMCCHNPTMNVSRESPFLLLLQLQE